MIEFKDLIDKRNYTKDLDENEKEYISFARIFASKIRAENFEDNKTVEVLNAQGKFNPLKPFLRIRDLKSTNKDYTEKEIKWYMSESKSIINYVDDIAIWNQVSSKDGKKEVNSNYGYLVFSKENGEQYTHAINAFINDKGTRQSIIIYTRPSIQTEWNENGKHDMICTFETQHFIRHEKLEYIVYQRSCDFYFGLLNDFVWHCFVYQNMLNDLQKTYKQLKPGKIHWNFGSLHVYPRHFDLTTSIIHHLDYDMPGQQDLFP